MIYDEAIQELAKPCASCGGALSLHQFECNEWNGYLELEVRCVDCGETMALIPGHMQDKAQSKEAKALRRKTIQGKIDTFQRHTRRLTTWLEAESEDTP